MRPEVGAHILAAFVACLAAAPSASAALVQCRPAAGGAIYGFDSGPLRLDLRTRAGRLTLARLAAPGGPNRVTGRPTGGLWLVRLTGPDGDKSLTDADATDLTVTASADRAVFRWQIPLQGAACKVTMTVRIAGNDPLSYWSLEVATPDAYRLADVEFPRLTNLRLRPDSKLAIPWCDGVECDLRAGMGYDDVYPSMLVSMQFVALYSDGEGVYMAAHDPRASSKNLRAHAREDGVAVVFSPWPEWGGATWSPGYETAVGVFCGDWRQAAVLYRAFAATTPWWRAAATQPTPSWFGDIDLWLLNDATSFGLDTKACLEAAEFYAGVRRGIHWYNWYQDPGTMSSYPDFPAREGFADAVRQMKQAGYKVMPYMDGRLWSRDNPSWQTEHAEELAVRRLDGSLLEDYTSCGVMCSWLPRWHDKIAAVARRLVTEHGADAVYVDEIGAARAARCHARDHGHPLRGGPWWVDGYRDMSGALRKALPSDVAFTTEHAAECYLGSFDGFCTVNNSRVPPGIGRAIPLFTTVYAGRTTPFGFRCDDCTEDGFAHPLAFRQNQMDGFLTGGQLGWVHSRILMQPKAAAEAAFLRNLARLRAQVHPFLARGTFLTPVTVTGDNPRLTAEILLPNWMLWVPDWAPFAHRSTARYRLDMPAVQATAWRAADNSLGIALANASAQERAVTIELPLKAAGIPTDAKLLVRAIGPDGPVNETTITGSSLNLRVMPDSALFLVVSQK